MTKQKPIFSSEESMKRFIIIDEEEGVVLDHESAWIKSISSTKVATQYKHTFRRSEPVAFKTTYYFEFGDKKQNLNATYDSFEEATKDWKRIIAKINGEVA